MIVCMSEFDSGHDAKINILKPVISKKMDCYVKLSFVHSPAMSILCDAK